MSPTKKKNSSRQKKLREKRKTTLKKEIGAKIRKVRKAHGYTQDQIVDYFDCGRANYSRIEKGEVFPNPTILKVLADNFNVSLGWLICGKGEMFGMADEKEKLTKKLATDEIEAEEISLLLDHFVRVPMVKHAVLGFFLEYKAKNKKIIAPYLEEETLQKELKQR